MLEPVQYGARPLRDTRGAVVRLQYVINEAQAAGANLYITYTDFFSAFSSINVGRLFSVLRALGMAEVDVQLLERAYEGTWHRIETDFGDTAPIPLSRGTPQGSALSPSIFVLFLNLCLRLLADVGRGCMHACGIRRHTLWFLDDLALVSMGIHVLYRSHSTYANIRDFMVYRSRPGPVCLFWSGQIKALESCTGKSSSLKLF